MTRAQASSQSYRKKIDDKISNFYRVQLVSIVATMIIGWGAFFYFLPTLSDALEPSPATSPAFWLYVAVGAYFPSMLFKILKRRILRCPGCRIPLEKLDMITNLERLRGMELWPAYLLTKESKLDERVSSCSYCGLRLDSKA